MTIRKLDESTDNVLGYEVRGRITKEEFETFEKDFEAEISTHGKVRILLYLPEIPAIEPGALWEDLKLARYLRDIEKYAVVSDSDFAEWGAKVNDAVVRSFDTSQYDEAWRWVRE